MKSYEEEQLTVKELVELMERVNQENERTVFQCVARCCEGCNICKHLQEGK